MVLPMRLLICSLSACFLALAQVDTGNVSGTVTDSSGGGVGEAEVHLTSELTGTIRTTITNPQGYYTFPFVPSGRYGLNVERSGFKTFQRSGIGIQVNQQVNVPVTLEVGQVTEQINVSGAGLLVETTSGAIRETVDHQRITELPLNGRNVLQLQSLLPGSVPTGSLDQGANTPGFAFNGGTGASNNYSLDGGQYQDAYFNGPLPFPNPDAIQEFSVQTSSYSAEFGRNRGASINAVTKSGSNQFHGGAFEFLRNDLLDARPFFSREAPHFKRNQFGAHLGGPIRRNQTFFFFAWQGTKERGTTNTSTSTVPNAQMRGGDFSQTARVIRDPQTGQPFPGNIIPSDRLNQPALRFLDRFVPLPNFSQLNYVIPLNRPLDGNEYVTRVDHDFSSRDRFYARYLFNKDHVFNPAGNFAGWGIDQTFRRQSAVVNETHTFSPALLNSLTVTFNRVKSDIIPEPDFSWSDFGANIPPAAPGIVGWHNIAVNGYFTAVNGTFWDLARNSYNTDETLSWTRGGHSMRFGAQISRYQVNQVNEFLSRGSFSFNGFATGLPEAILTDSGLKITPLDASEPPAAKDFIERTAALLPHIKITELLQEVDKWTGFTRHFKHLKTGEPAKDKLLLLSVILADGINIGLTKMAESCPGTTYAKLAWLECFRSQFCRALISLRLTSSTQPRR